MKVLVISTVELEKNGITSVILNLMQSIDKKNLHFDVVAIKRPLPDVQKKLEALGCKIFILERSFHNILFYIGALSRIIKKERYDIVHAHGNSSTLFFEMISAYIGNCKIRIAHSHNTTCTSKFVNAVLKPLFKLAYTDGMACGQDAGSWMFGNNKFTVIKNGINVNAYSYDETKRIDIRKRYSIPENGIVIGHVGVFNNQKNHKFLFEIYSEIYKYNADIYLMLIGDGRLKRNFENDIQNEEYRHNVIFVGTTNNVNSYLCAMDAVAMPSLYEGLPLAVIEEQANGLSCILSENITKEVDKTGNVVFFSLNDKESWVNYITDVKINKNRQLTSSKAIEDIIKSGYSIEDEAQKLREYYFNALEREV